MGEMASIYWKGQSSIYQVHKPGDAFVLNISVTATLA